MTFLKKLGCAAALAVSVSAAQAAPILNDWVFNPNGGGYHKGQDIGEYLDINGSGFIQLKATSATSFTFTEHAVFNLSQADSNGKLFPLNYTGGNISAVLVAYGTGTYGKDFTFTGGTIRMYQNPVTGQYGSTAGYYGANLGNLIASFDVLMGGGGNVDAKGSPLSNGQVSVFASAQPGMLAAGYFFDRQGNDLSRFAVDAFAFTNASTTSRPGSRLVQRSGLRPGRLQGSRLRQGQLQERRRRPLLHRRQRPVQDRQRSAGARFGRAVRRRPARRGRGSSPSRTLIMAARRSSARPVASKQEKAAERRLFHSAAGRARAPPPVRISVPAWRAGWVRPRCARSVAPGRAPLPGSCRG
nr:hypothetical protein [Massilia sp. Dwa41.01b]